MAEATKTLGGLRNHLSVEGYWLLTLTTLPDDDKDRMKTREVYVMVGDEPKTVASLVTAMLDNIQVFKSEGAAKPFADLLPDAAVEIAKTHGAEWTPRPVTDFFGLRYDVLSSPPRISSDVVHKADAHMSLKDFIEDEAEGWREDQTIATSMLDFLQGILHKKENGARPKKAKRAAAKRQKPKAAPKPKKAKRRSKKTGRKKATKKAGSRKAAKLARLKKLRGRKLKTKLAKRGPRG
jgi:hypothetical protein